MTNFQPVAKFTHSSLRWKRFDTHHFAAQEALVPLVQSEMQRACMVLPIAIVRQPDDWLPAAVQGVQPGHNLFVAPDGRWVGAYTPAAYRVYPFALGKHDSGQQLLCVNAESGLVGPEDEDFVEPFFDQQGQPSASVKAVLYFLEQVQANRVVTHTVCEVLAHEGLLEPWPATVRVGEQTEQTIQGLHRVSEAKFKALGPEALFRLHQAGTLPLIYCQLLSMQHLPLLGKLADAHAKAKAHAQGQANAPLDFEQLLHASEVLADAPGAHKGGVNSSKNGQVSDDWNWSL